MEGPRHERSRAFTYAEIKSVARHIMSAKGIAAMTLRSIAEQMGFTSQAIYRYFKSRDALIMELTLDAYRELQTTMEAARDTFPLDAYDKRLYAVLMTYRHWAITHPVDYTLLYATPIVCDHELSKQLQKASMCVPSLIYALLYAAQQHAQLQSLEEYMPLPDEVREQLLEYRTSMFQQVTPNDIALELLQTTFVFWSRLHGMILLEICNHFAAMSDAEALYRFEVLTLLQRLGLSPKK